MKKSLTTSLHLITASAAAFCALTLLPPPGHASPPQYAVTVLGTVGGTTSYSIAINNSGQVAGYSFTTGNSYYHAVRWTGTTRIDLGTLGGTFSSKGFGINNSGEVVGSSSTKDGFAEHAVRWSGGTPTDLGALGGVRAGASGINASGLIAGWFYQTEASNGQAVRWSGGTPTVLGTLGGTRSYCFGINDSGQIAGWSDSPSGWRAVRWTGTTPTELGTLAGSSSLSFGINASGQIAGRSYTPSGWRAVRWTGTTPTDLGTLGGTNSESYGGINGSGDVVGISDTTGNAASHAFLYSSGTMYDLNTLLVPGSGITGLIIYEPGNNINDIGQIAITGTIGGQNRALRLDPVGGGDNIRGGKSYYRRHRDRRRLFSHRVATADHGDPSDELDLHIME